MGLFGKKKKAEETEEEAVVNETVDTAEEDEQEEAASPDEETAAAGSADEELSVEDIFKREIGMLGQRIRFMFPQQMLIGFYYAEFQSDEYIDDFCCYTETGELIERDDIPARCGMSYPDMVAREEKLEQAFFRFRKAAEAYTNKPCNGVSVTMMNNGQVKFDVISQELVEDEADARYAKFREKVEKGNPRYLPPKISKETAEAIQKKTAPAYQELGTEFFSFLPETEFKKAYFYCEIGDEGIFMYHRIVLEDGEILDGEDMYERFGMDKEAAEKNRMEIVRLIMDIRNIIISEQHKPFSTVTLTITSKGEFQSFMGFGKVDPEGEQARLDEWKAHFNGKESVTLPPQP